MRAPSPGFLLSLAVLAALAHAVWAVTASAGKSMTADEIAHLTAGHVYNTRGDFRLHPENGNLPQRWAALPLTVAGAPLPSADEPSWRRGDVWNYGHAFFFGQAVPADTWLLGGRAMIALFSAATGLLVFLWSRALFGWRGGFVSLALFIFSPTFLAHGALATSDVVMTFFLLASVGAWWRHLETPGWRTTALSVGAFALAWVAKFSAVLLVPILALIALAWAGEQARKDNGRDPLRRVVRSAVVHALGAWMVVWLFFGLRFSPFAPGSGAEAGYYHGWPFLLADLTWPRPLVLAAQKWHLLPDAFLYGFTFVYQFAQQRAAFFNGEHSVHGWPGFFPYAFLVKSTPALLTLVALGIGAAIRRLALNGIQAGWTRWRPLLPLVVLFVVYWATSITSHLNIGHRHILPVYPVLFIAAGAFGGWLVRQRPLAGLAVAALLAGHVYASVQIRPHYLAYFNALAGGPANGWRHLVDSSLDWGQDLPALRDWLERHAPGEPAYLSYFGAGDPAYEGIRAHLLPRVPEVGPPRRWHALGPGIYALSATMLQQVFSPVRGEWTAERELEYQRLRALEPTFLAFQENPARRAELLREASEQEWTTAWRHYEDLRLARLCLYLQVRQPDDQAGFSILIHRLTDEEIRIATQASLRELAALIAAQVPH